jgi:hypothetical protein
MEVDVSSLKEDDVVVISSSIPKADYDLASIVAHCCEVWDSANIGNCPSDSVRSSCNYGFLYALCHPQSFWEQYTRLKEKPD